MIALGGVATGSINASEAANVAGIINSRGLTWIVTARPARMGRIISVVAVLDVNSVSKDIMVTITEVRTMGWVPANPDNCSPNHMDRPDSTNPFARANPPPNRSTMCQGRRLAVSQSMILSPFLDLDGMMKRISAIAMATVPSFKYSGLLNSCDHPGMFTGPI
jgi:hypothetical protein